MNGQEEILLHSILYNELRRRIPFALANALRWRGRRVASLGG